MKIGEYVVSVWKARLDASRVLVIHDPDGRYRELALSFAGQDCTVVDGSSSTIEGREKALDGWLELPKGNGRLLVYLPTPRPKNESQAQVDPYQIFSLAGAEFPCGDSDSFQELCRQAHPGQNDLVDSLFLVGEPDFQTVDALEGGSIWPVLSTLVHSDSPVDILKALLAPSPDLARRLDEDPSWLGEYGHFVQKTVGLKAAHTTGNVENLRNELWRYVLFSELALDLPGDLPPALKGVPAAGSRLKSTIFALCDALRESDATKEIYIEKARAISEQLSLSERFRGISELGERDTFEFESECRLALAAEVIASNDLTKAAEFIKTWRTSIWATHVPERTGLWSVVEKGIHLLIELEDAEGFLGQEAFASLQDVVRAYSRRFALIDRLCRAWGTEIAGLDLVPELLEPGIRKARDAYSTFVAKVQAIFVRFLQLEGWPPEKGLRATQLFDHLIAPHMTAGDGQKTALLVIDALRYELALELRERLSGEAEVQLEAAYAQLPAFTPSGMAALLPGADGGLHFKVQDAALVPYIGDVRVSTAIERMAFIRGIYGDRFFECKLSDLFKLKKSKVPSTASLLLVRSSEIDAAGENLEELIHATLPSLLRRILAAVSFVQKLGFARIVILSDHGFVLLPEVLPGSSVSKPPGDWAVRKERVLLGKGSPEASSLVAPCAHFGIPLEGMMSAFPRNFGAYVAGSSYFHGGLSLQECVIPVLTLVPVAKKRKPRKSHVNMSYRQGMSSSVTTRRPMIDISVPAQSGQLDLAMDEADAVTCSVQAIAKTDNAQVGEVGACEVLDPTTKLVRLLVGRAVRVPLRMKEDFHGEFMVRAIDPVTQEILCSLELKTDYVE